MKGVPAITWLHGEDRYAHVAVSETLTACGERTTPSMTWLEAAEMVRCETCRKAVGDLARDDGIWQILGRDKVVHRADLTTRVRISHVGGSPNVTLSERGSARCGIGPSPRHLLSRDEGRVNCLTCLGTS